MSDAPTTLRYHGRTVRLKWHKLRQRADDPPFARANLRAGLAAGASLEVDLRRLACGRMVCLHDDVLEGETTGSGPVGAIDSSDIARLAMREGAGEPPLLLDELVEIMREALPEPSALVQLDLKIATGEIDDRVRELFAAAIGDLAERFILSGLDWDAVLRLRGGIEGLALGYDPTDEARSAVETLCLIDEKSPKPDTIYLHRDLVRTAHEQGDSLVATLRERGHRIDCWTIDHGTEAATFDLLAAIASGCDQITTNTPSAWAGARLEDSETS